MPLLLASIALAAFFLLSELRSGGKGLAELEELAEEEHAPEPDAAAAEPEAGAEAPDDAAGR